MSEAQYHKIEAEFAEAYGTVGAKMFGKPCMKATNNKAFVAFFQNDMVFKLGQEEISLLMHKYPGAVNWDPSGKNRPMKDWLQVPEDFQHDWQQLAQKALEFVGGHS